MRRISDKSREPHGSSNPRLQRQRLLRGRGLQKITHAVWFVWSHTCLCTSQCKYLKSQNSSLNHMWHFLCSSNIPQMEPLGAGRQKNEGISLKIPPGKMRLIHAGALWALSTLRRRHGLRGARRCPAPTHEPGRHPLLFPKRAKAAGRAFSGGDFALPHVQGHGTISRGDVLRGGSLELLGWTEPACARVWLGVNQTLHPQHTPGTRNLRVHACAASSC